MASAIHPEIKKITDSFIDQLKAAYGDGLVSVIIYGSGASGESSRRHSNINIAVILKDASLRNLARSSGALGRYKFRLLDPVFFTEDYLKTSADVFPIEFLDIKENHIVLYGSDPVKDLPIDLKNLRFQCEQELKVRLINVKRSYLRLKNSGDLRALLFRSATSVLHIARNLLRLKGKIPPYRKEEILAAISGEFGVDIAAFTAILKAKNENRRLGKNEIEGLFFAFTDALEKMADIVDHL
jgi:hypothetical protein